MIFTIKLDVGHFSLNFFLIHFRQVLKNDWQKAWITWLIIKNMGRTANSNDNLRLTWTIITMSSKKIKMCQMVSRVHSKRGGKLSTTCRFWHWFKLFKKSRSTKFFSSIILFIIDYSWFMIGLKPDFFCFGTWFRFFLIS